jgi:hypothetical protein
MTTRIRAVSTRPAPATRPDSPIPRDRFDRRASAATVTLVLSLGLAVVAAGCSPNAAPTAPGATPGGTGSPTTAPPSGTPVPGAINHPTGAKDVVLRMETGGGMIVEANAVATPTFTLYGDGTIVFRDPTAAPPEPIGGVRREVPFSIVRVGEEGIQALLQEALGAGGLALATGPYLGMGADIPTTTFTISVEGRTKQVTVSGFLPDLHPQDAVIVAALGHLAEQLDGFASSIAGEATYVPAAFRGVLISLDQPFGPVVAWPWPDLSPDDFAGGETDLFRTRTLAPDDVAALGIEGVDGGLSGLVLELEGRHFSFALRPLLPDEDA